MEDEIKKEEKEEEKQEEKPLDKMIVKELLLSRNIEESKIKRIKHPPRSPKKRGQKLCWMQRP